MSKEEAQHDEVVAVPSQHGHFKDQPDTEHDAVFGEMREGGPNYRNVREK